MPTASRHVQGAGQEGRQSFFPLGTATTRKGEHYEPSLLRALSERTLSCAIGYVSVLN